MRIAVLVKQVPRVESMELRSDGRLQRDGVELEMNAYCRRAVSEGVELAQASGGRCTVLTLGPPSAGDVLREALAWGADDATLITDPAFAGSDTLATARALAAAVEREGPFDLVLAGRNSIDADTGQVGPEVAELLDLPFAAGVRELTVADGVVEARCELDDGWRTVRLRLPAVLSAAERLTEPCKVPPEGRAEVAARRIRTVSAAELGPGPWGEAGSPTSVGRIRTLDVDRRRIRLDGPVADQVAEVVELLARWGVLGRGEAASGARGQRGPVRDDNESAEPDPDDVEALPENAAPGGGGPVVAVVAEPGRSRCTRELLGEAAHLARIAGGEVVAVGSEPGAAAQLASWGADRVVRLDGVSVEEDVAAALAQWAAATPQLWAVLAPGTLWGREVAGRVAARLGAGLTGDAVGFGVEDGRLVSWKPAFGGRLVAAITTSSPVQLATVRPGVMPLRRARSADASVPVERRAAASRGRVEVIEAGRDDDVEMLLAARRVVCVGQGVPSADYDELTPLLHALGAELGATRKVTDKGWLPRARQIGITGHSVAPALLVVLGASGKFNHMVGSRGAGTVVAVNTDPDAPVFASADVGIVGDWREVVKLLTDRLA